MPKIKPIKSTIRLTGNLFFLPSEELKSKLKLEYAFNPAVTQEDYTPGEEDFVHLPYRFITAAIVAKGTWRSTDFTDEQVLKKSLAMLDNKPAMRNHWQGGLGTVTKPTWSGRMKDSAGNEIPPGINGYFKIDAKSNIELVRSLLANPPSIQAASVSVVFEWVPSHDFKKPDGSFDKWRFFDSVGSEIDGKEVSFKVVNVIDYNEVSLVDAGADKYAKALDSNGVPINVRKFSEESLEARSDFQEKREYEAFEYYAKESLFSEIVDIDDVERHLDIEFEYEEEAEPQEPVEPARNFEAEILTEKNKATLLKAEVDLLKDQIEKLQSAKELSAAEVETLKAQLSQQAPLVAQYNELIAGWQNECEELYRATVKNPDETIISEIKNSDFNSLKARFELLGNVLKSKFTPHCKDCNSNEIAWHSAKTNPEQSFKKQQPLTDKY